MQTDPMYWVLGEGFLGDSEGKAIIYDRQGLYLLHRKSSGRNVRLSSLRKSHPARNHKMPNLFQW